MKIKTIQIGNFRGVHKLKEFNLEGKPFVLLSAPNGLGKTTLIDAIEWCLTGNIGRLENSFKSRGTSSPEEKKENVEGILKNKNANADDEVCVVLQMQDKTDSFEIKRTQKKDELNKGKSQLWINGSKTEAKNWINKFIGNNFYNFHFCDIQKSIGIQNKKRKELPELFSDFISDYTSEQVIANNLKIFADDTARYIGDLENERKSDEQIKTLSDMLRKYGEKPEIIEYPKKPIFAQEILNVKELSEDKLKQQNEKLYECGYKQVENILTKLKEDKKLKKNIDALEKIRDTLKVKKSKIEEAIKKGLDKDKDIIQKYKKKISENKQIELTKINIWDYSSKLLGYKHNQFTDSFYNTKKEEIEKLETKKRNLEKEIKTLSKGNQILDSFASIIAKKDGIQKYRKESLDSNGKVKCPVCGSLQFGELKEEELFNEIEKYNKQHSELLSLKKIAMQKLNTTIEEKFEILLKVGKQVIDDQIIKDEKDKNYLIALKDETKEFFDYAKELDFRNSDEEIDLEKLLIINNVKELISTMCQKSLSDKTIREAEVEYVNILDLLKYKIEDDENENSILQRIKELAKNPPEVVEFSRELLIQKINSINSILNNKEYIETRKKIDEYTNKNKEIDKKKAELQILMKKAQGRADEIEHLISCLKEEEYNLVGPNLYKYYKKLSRINSINEIHISVDEEKLSLKDESERNIVNVLSNGQLSVFMLAFFFAGIVSRSKNELCKIYFIDDLTACMDDVNMLAFLDLMKYQLSSGDGEIEQLFFSSCDIRIGNLLRYKLDGCGIDYCELSESDFISVE